MKNIREVIFFIIIIFINSIAFSATIEFDINTRNVCIYDKVEITIKDTFQAKNNYDYSMINVKGYFKIGEDILKEIDGFYIKNYQITETGDISEKGTSEFKIRFTPDKVGKWSYKIKVFSGKNLVAETKWQTFYCNKNDRNYGFIRISRNDDLFMEFDNKKPFYAIGLNLCWSTGNVLKDYERWLSEL
ncbi:MAG: DUF5060 domain-containing protein, partial [Candidatus Goldbacteria bacterium]|nr:DUF5060 domain-containing protein [Candidatus Goldiibacteriota bacterium]